MLSDGAGNNSYSVSLVASPAPYARWDVHVADVHVADLHVADLHVR